MDIIPVTVVILACNERRELQSLADSLAPHFDDILMLDSGSLDGTIELAEELGWKVFKHPFTGFGDQRNWAIDNMPHRYPWVLHLDADERPTTPFLEELRRVVESNPTEAGFFVPSKLMLGEHWLRYSSGYPVFQVRLFHRERLRFANFGHGQRELTSGRLGYLQQPYLHYGFSKGFEAWLEKHARYAAGEAREALASQSAHLTAELTSVFSADPVSRRRAMKQLSMRLPARPLLRLLYTLVLKRGILDGKAGIAYARLLAAYEAMIAAYISAEKAARD